MNTELSDHVQEDKPEQSGSSSIEELKTPEQRQIETMKKLAKESSFKGGEIADGA